MNLTEQSDYMRDRCNRELEIINAIKNPETKLLDFEALCLKNGFLFIITPIKKEEPNDQEENLNNIEENFNIFGETVNERLNIINRKIDKLELDVLLIDK